MNQQQQQGLYDAFSSAYQGSPAAAGTGSWRNRMAGDRMQEFASQLTSTTGMPNGTNGAEQDAMDTAGSSMVSGEWARGLGAVSSQNTQLMNIGSAGVSSLQGVKNAKTMADMQAQSAQQQANASMLSSGLSAFGSIAGAFKAGGAFGSSKPSGSFQPSASLTDKANSYGSRAFSSSFSSPSSAFRYS